jgi:hypothetical protein
MHWALSKGDSTSHQQKTRSNADKRYSTGWRLDTVNAYLRLDTPTTPVGSYKSTYHPWPSH